MRGAYFNEFDPYAAAWLRNLISAGHLPAGDVDERSIVDVRPGDLAGYTQCHFFAGIGGWGHALRLAGWADERPIWTGSCPCQPFSNAGKGAGTDDARHLWPYFMGLIAAVRPPVVMGEQVAGSAGYGWLDGVRADLAGEGYASRGVDIPACAVDAPHIRQRLYWIAVADSAPGRARLQGPDQGAGEDRHTSTGKTPGPHGGDVADANVPLVPGQSSAGQLAVDEPDAGAGVRAGPGNAPTTFWSAHDRLLCHDGKTRRTQPGVPLLVNGVRGRVAIGCAIGQADHPQADHLINRIGVWRGAGNAIVPQEAEQVIRAYMDVAP